MRLKCIPSILTASLATKTVQYAISVRRQVTSKHHVIKESVAVVVEKDMMGKAAPPRGFLRIRSSLRSRTTVTKDDYMTAKSTDTSS